MAIAESKQELSYPARRILRKYEPAFRARLLHYLKLRAVDLSNLSWDDITDAVSHVFTELTESKGPRFDSETERRALDDYANRRYKSTQEWINELSSRLA